MAGAGAHGGMNRPSEATFSDEMAPRGGLDADQSKHFLHHKYVNVHYGIPLVALDKWLKIFRDDSDEATSASRKRAPTCPSRVGRGLDACSPAKES